MLFGSRGHYSMSLPCPHVWHSGREAHAQASEDGTADCAEDGTAGAQADSGAAGTAASDLISMRQPVSLAASLAFCPSLPIASDSW